MEYSLQALYYLIRGYINLLLQVEVTEGVTVGGISFAVMLLSGIFVSIGLIGSYTESGFHMDGRRKYAALPDHKGVKRGGNFTMR